MKHIIITLVILLSFTVSAHADLNLLGQGTSTHGTYNLIYDTDLDITWYDYSNSGDFWVNQVSWADALSVTFGNNVYNDWRLPTVTDIGNDGCNYGYSGTDCGYNVDTSSGELAYLWYDELGNTASYDTAGNPTGCGIHGCLTSTGDFQSLQSGAYWTGTMYGFGTQDAWDFGFASSNGYQNHTNKTASYSTNIIHSFLNRSRHIGSKKVLQKKTCLIQPVFINSSYTTTYRYFRFIS